MAAPPAPPAPMSHAAASAGVGAGALAREALGDQFTMLWVNNAVQGWVVGVAPGPLNLEQARAHIVEALTPHFAPGDLAYLGERLHVDPQPYGEAELRATQAQATADMMAANLGVFWRVGHGLCVYTDTIRVVLQLYDDSTPEIVERVRAIVAPQGDRVLVVVLPHGPPRPAIALPIAPGPTPAPAISVQRYVSTANAKRCIRGAVAKIAMRRGQTGVRSLSVKAGGRRRTISGARLRKPIEVRLTRARTPVEMTVKLRDGRTGTRSVTFTRCR